MPIHFPSYVCVPQSDPPSVKRCLHPDRFFFYCEVSESNWPFPFTCTPPQGRRLLSWVHVKAYKLGVGHSKFSIFHRWTFEQVRDPLISWNGKPRKITEMGETLEMTRDFLRSLIRESILSRANFWDFFRMHIHAWIPRFFLWHSFCCLFHLESPKFIKFEGNLETTACTKMLKGDVVCLPFFLIANITGLLRFHQLKICGCFFFENSKKAIRLTCL